MTSFVFAFFKVFFAIDDKIDSSFGITPAKLVSGQIINLFL